MKKTILFFVLLNLLNFGFGQVGIQTENPTETLHVNGELRIQNIPVDEESQIYTKPDGTRSNAKDQTFIGAQPLVADQNGVIGTSRIGVTRSNCYASTTQNFSEVPSGNGVAQVDFTKFSFRYDPTTTAATANFIKIRNNTTVTLYGITKLDRSRDSYREMVPGVWERQSDNINYDTEASGELFFFTDVDATGVSNIDTDVYTIKYISEKRTSNSFPTVCLFVNKLQ